MRVTVPVAETGLPGRSRGPGVGVGGLGVDVDPTPVAVIETGVLVAMTPPPTESSVRVEAMLLVNAALAI